MAAAIAAPAAERGRGRGGRCLSRNLASYVILAAVAFSGLWNARSIRIAHANGDQRAYVAMAMKLENFGFSSDSYRLHDVRIRRQGDLIVYSPHEDGEGDLLRQLQAEGTPFYVQPLFHAPPLFPALIWLSHRVLAPDAPFAVLAHDRSTTSSLTLRQRWQAQGYALVVPLLCTMLLVLATGLIGAMFAGPNAAALAAWLVAVAPVGLLCAQRVWADSLLAVGVTTAALCFWQARERDSLRWAVASGLALGLALLTKNNAILAVPILAFALLGRRLSWRRRGLLLAISCGTGLLAASPWYAMAWSAFGTPWFNPSQPGIAQTHPWFAAINARPWSTYLVGVPWQNPLLLLGIVLAPWWLLRAQGVQRWLAFWSLLYVVVLTIETQRSEMLGPDHRYLLPAYPALAATSAHWCASQRRHSRLVLLAVLLSVGWSLWLAQRHWDADLILAPF